MQATRPMIVDWYDMAHFEDWQHKPLKPCEDYYLVEPSGEKYYLVEPLTRYVEVIPADEIRTYLDLGREASEGWVAYVLDEKYLGWSTETATGEESE